MTIAKETIEEMRAEGLDILVEFFKAKPDASTRDALIYFSKEASASMHMTVTCMPHPIMMGVARALAKRSLS